MATKLYDNRVTGHSMLQDDPARRRASDVRVLLGLLNTLPDSQPPPHLVHQTVQRVEQCPLPSWPGENTP